MNVSVHQILAGHLADQVVEALRDSTSPPARLTLEITESAALGDSDRVARSSPACRRWECASRSTTSARATRRWAC